VRASRLPRTARAAAAGLAAAVALLTVAVARADDPGALRRAAEQLQRAQDDLSARSRGALLELYALESKLKASERQIDALQVSAAELDREQASARKRLAIAESAREQAELELGERLRALYIEGDVDPIEVLLGADSLSDAVSALDGLTQLAEQDRQVIAQVEETSADLEAAFRALAERESKMRVLEEQALSAQALLAAAKLERTSYLEALAQTRELNDTEIARLLAEAAAIEARAEELAREAAPSASASTEPSSGAEASAVTQALSADGHTMTVTATGYALPGHTATGLPVGWGVVAVDPAVIPLGTRMTIPGYGEGVAADTGSAVRGTVIDLWFSSTTEALAWGTRTVTITLH
jgi:cystine transport system substrate-binding protein